MILGGVKRIAAVATRLVPTMAGLYLIAGLIVVAVNIQHVPMALFDVIRGAFGYDAAVGGFTGAAMWLAMQRGIARGIFSNEAGQGSAPIAHAAAKNDDPVDQGLIAMLGTLIDTLIVCTITGLAILTTGVVAGGDTGAPLTAAAFNSVLPGGDHVVTFGLVLFAFTTILGWSYYGERCAEFLFGEGAILPYRLLYLAMIPAGAMVLYAENNGVENIIFLVWLTTDTLTGLMAAPNLIALAVLSPFIFKITQGYFDAKERGEEKTFIAAALREKPGVGRS
ncbi:MAG: alanine:cation symporter family protein [Pseudomonadota bacterium]